MSEQSYKKVIHVDGAQQLLEAQCGLNEANK